MLSCFFIIFAEKMKKGILYIVLTFLLSVINVTVGAQSMSNADSIQISLLTCSAGKEVWAQYGHTAIRYYDKESGEDFAINYGQGLNHADIIYACIIVLLLFICFLQFTGSFFAKKTTNRGLFKKTY